jgi:hypothetical protein
MGSGRDAHDPSVRFADTSPRVNEGREGAGTLTRVFSCERDARGPEDHDATGASEQPQQRRAANAHDGD